LGFLGANNLPRVCDTNGENKWDSTRAFIADFLRPVGNLLREMTWERSRSWYCNEGETQLVSKVISQRQDAPDPIDRSYETFVETAEFSDAGTNYLFVLNGRTHREGQRHITVKPTPMFGNADILVTEVRSASEDGDVWVVRPDKTPDSTTTANGFTDYFEAGEARLYRISPYVSGSVPFGDACFAHTLTVTKGATVALRGESILLAPTGEIVVEDSLVLAGCVVSCCDLENIANIYVRDGGRLRLTMNGGDSTTVERVPISVGPGSSIHSDQARFSGIWYGTGAINLYDGYARTNHNTISVQGGGHFVDMYGGELFASSDSVQGNNCCWTVGVNAIGGQAYVQGERFLDLTIGISAVSGAHVQGCDSAVPAVGRNKIRSYMLGMYCSYSELQFGERPWGSLGNWYASQNSIGVTDTLTAWHISAPSGNAFAHANFWCQGTTPPLQSCTPHTYGNVDALGALNNDPVPLIGDPDKGKTTLTKDMNVMASMPPSGIRQTVLQFLASGTNSGAQTAIDNFLRSGGGQSVDVEDLGFVYRAIKRIGAQSLVVDLLVTCVSRQDLRSKLLAADILKWEGDPRSALSVLNGYSFLGSDELLRDAQVRKAILYPQSFQGGYINGLAVVDSLRSLVLFDSTLVWFIERYPRLFSGLTLSNPGHIPKTAQRDYSDLLLPTGIDVWPNYPNPFADITSFTFKLGEATHVRLAVFDAMGREVAVVADADYERGVHSAVLRSGTLPNGLYFYRLITDAGVIQRKMLLLR
jgi:hypothetical protein